MTDESKEYVLVHFSLPQLRGLEKLLRGHSRSLAIKAGRDGEAPAERMKLVSELLNIVSDTLLEIDTYEIIGDVMRDGTFEEIVKTWQSATGDHG